MYDVKITGARIVDGSGQTAYSGDVGILGGRIVALGEAPDSASRVVSADGRVVAPGFVDIHTHYDAQVLWDSMLSVSPWHGVTTVVMGNCGFGVAPTRREHRDFILKTLERVEGMSLASLEAGLGDWGFSTFPEYMDAIERAGVAINVAAMVGHTPIRFYAMGPDAIERPAKPAELEKMHALVVDAMRAGAVGFSTSIVPSHIGFGGKPVASRFADFEEFRTIARALREADAGLITISSGRTTMWEKLELLMRDSGRPLCMMSVMSATGEHRERLRKVAEMHARGLPITAQTACQPIVMEFDFDRPGGLSSWHNFKPVHEAPDGAARRGVYADPQFRATLREEVAGRGGNDAHFSGGALEGTMRRQAWFMMEIAWYPPEPALVGKTLGGIAAERGVNSADLFLDMALASDLRGRVRLPLTNYIEDEGEEILRDPNVVLGLSDAGAHLSQLCDAGYSSHLLGHWVRERKSLSLEYAVRILTSRPAGVFGIADRGLLASGRPADIVMFDPDTIGVEPEQRVTDLPGGGERIVKRSRGIDLVMVNGTILPPQGEALAARRDSSGKVLRFGHA